MTQKLDRREFFRRAAVLGGGAFMAPGLVGLSACSHATNGLPRTPGYGPLVRSAEVPELWIPQGFRVRKISTTQAPSLVNPNLTVRYGVDGMSAFPASNGSVRLVRNHEVADNVTVATLLGPGERAYDRKAGGGTSTLQLRQAPDGEVALEQEFISLSGTHTNCAGGRTPWGTWITCEETTVGQARGFEQPHGYCFEVAASANGEVQPVPLKAMGRFVHEAVAVDPATSIVYLTEDILYDATVPAGRAAGFYRFVPATPGDLRTGRLQMLSVVDRPNYITFRGQQAGVTYPTGWVDISDPDPAQAEANSSAVFQQGWARGGAAFQRLEGCFAADGSIYFNSTSGGNVGAGQVWRYRPGRAGAGELTLVFESPSRDVLDSPDNLCVSPRGGLVICEDGLGVQFVRGLTLGGEIFDLVHTDGPSAETAGACFSPNGRTLFFNIQGGTNATASATMQGGTYAIWGPWEDGAL